MEHGNVNIVVKSIKQKVDCRNTFMITMLKLEKMEEPLLGTTNRRSLLIDKLLWTEDGWPYVEGYSASTTAEVPYVKEK